MAQTSRNAIMGRYQTRGEDFLHLIDNSGNVVGGFDQAGVGWGTLQGGMIPPVTKTLHVDNTRTDSFVADGSMLKPFSTIQAAVDQISANGDNSLSVPYRIDIAAGSYPEMIVLENPNLVYLAFDGHGSAQIPSVATPVGLRSQANNSNLQRVDIFGLHLAGSTSTSVTLSGSGNFLSQHLNWCHSFLNLQSWTQTGGNTNLFGWTQFQCNSMVLTNLGPDGFEFIGGAYASTGGTISLVNAILSVQRGSRCQSDVSIDATSSYFLHPGCRQDNSIIGITVNGVFANRGMVTAPITVNSGGTYTEYGGVHLSTLTINAGGNYNQSGVIGASGLVLSGTAPTVAASKIGLGGTTSATALAGVGLLPANPAGFLVINIGGTPQKIPYYN